MARSMRVCVKQRQRTPDMACWICASLARGFLSSSALAVRTTPLRQKPHCAACSSMKAFCSGCGLSMVPMPSSVVTSFCPTALTGVMQERIGLAVHDDRAGAALAQAAAEFGAAEFEIVAQHVQQRSGGIYVYRLAPTVNFQGEDDS